MSDEGQLSIAGRRLDVETWGSATPRTEPSIVFVHEGLESIAQWRDAPGRASATSGLATLAYNRSGHGRSHPVPDSPWPADWMSVEAHALAELLERHAAPPVRLVGHSDGGTISLLCAA